MKLIQVLANGLLALGFSAGTAHGSILPYAAASSAVIVEDIQHITNLSHHLRETLLRIDSDTIAESGGEAIDEFMDIAGVWSGDLEKWKSSSKSLCIQGAPFTDPVDAEPICAAFHAYAEAHCAAFVVLIDKRSFFDNTPLQYEMGAALRQQEWAVDAVNNYLLDAVPPCRGEVEHDYWLLQEKLRLAVEYFNENIVFNLDRGTDLKEYL
ncbi:hypothetical protein MMC07_008502 [Pseudocyphellaria aurata]|nr:hypothetical protein [Pseudocyphellaria aurata]